VTALSLPRYKRVWKVIPNSSPARYRRVWKRIEPPVKIDDWLHGKVVPIRKVPLKHRAVYRRTLLAAAEAARACGERLRVNSSYRTYEEQLALFRLYKEGRGSLAAVPGTSRHEQGNALDLSDSAGRPVQLNPKVREALIAHGFSFPVKSEPWHVERG
jgi:hypothetical protein